jgi:hypothetical protein
MTYDYQYVMHLYLRSCSLPVQAVSAFDTVNQLIPPYFCPVPIRKLKYPIIVLMLHLALASCSDRDAFARVSHSLSGCFGGEVNELTIYKTGDSTMAVLESTGMETRTVRLSNAQLDSFNKFVVELTILDDGGLCTTYEKYRLVMNNKVIKREDGHCHWKGFARLRKALFDPALAKATPTSGF